MNTLPFACETCQQNNKTIYDNCQTNTAYDGKDEFVIDEVADSPNKYRTAVRNKAEEQKVIINEAWLNSDTYGCYWVSVFVGPEECDIDDLTIKGL